MILGFKTKINGKPTHFVEKIMWGIYRQNKHFYNYEGLEYHIKCKEKGFVVDVENPFDSKIHTIREDAKNRWKVGNDIHFVINNRSKDRFQFAPILKVVSIQRIDISVRQRDDFSITHEVYIDDRLLKFDEFCEFSKNDGFDSIEDFKAWFNKDLRGGKIIHWTDKRY